MYTIKPPINAPSNKRPPPKQGLFSRFLAISWPKIVRFSFCKKPQKGGDAFFRSIKFANTHTDV